MADQRFSDALRLTADDVGGGGLTGYAPFVNSARDWLETGEYPDWNSLLNPTSPGDQDLLFGSLEQLGFESGGTGKMNDFAKAAAEAYGARFTDPKEKEAFVNAMNSAMARGQNQRLAREAEIMSQGRTPAIGPTRAELTGPTPTPTPTQTPKSGYGTPGAPTQDQMTELVASGTLGYEQAVGMGWIPPKGFPSPTPAP